jgi:hypothetical protein
MHWGSDKDFVMVLLIHTSDGGYSDVILQTRLRADAHLQADALLSFLVFTNALGLHCML